MSDGERVDDPIIRIVIAEDQALVRRGATILLSMESDMEVVGQARNGVEAVELAQRGLDQSLRGGRFDRNANSVRVFACSFCMMRLM